ncbi:MAG: hypothetical protein Q4B68_00100 [Bacteroidales bacterium]|nr:hypothetical protein [Bacteroidales bacterium]
MAHYSKSSIRSKVTSHLMNDDKTAALDVFLSLKIANNTTQADAEVVVKAPRLDKVLHLVKQHDALGSDSVTKVKYGDDERSKDHVQYFMVRLSPFCTLCLFYEYKELLFRVNSTRIAFEQIRCHTAQDVVDWLVMQQGLLDSYIEEWEPLHLSIAKCMKKNKLGAFHAQSMFEEAMKDYPDVKYLFKVQKRRLRVKVFLPESQLGVYLFAWWRSYERNFPTQIEALKKLVDLHRRIPIKRFFRQ